MENIYCVHNAEKVFPQFLKKYVNYVLQYHGKNVVVFFDGYPTEGNLRSTKSAERARYSRLHNSVEVPFDESRFPHIPKEKLLANEKTYYVIVL